MVAPKYFAKTTANTITKEIRNVSRFGALKPMVTTSPLYLAVDICLSRRFE
jgi:hypothetical protein